MRNYQSHIIGSERPLHSRSTPKGPKILTCSNPDFLQWHSLPSWTQLPAFDLPQHSLGNNQEIQTGTNHSLSPLSDSRLLRDNQLLSDSLISDSGRNETFRPTHFSEGVLDSPPFMFYDRFTTHMAPLSPPLTSPTFTTSLPKLDNGTPLSPLVGVRTLSISDTDSDSGSPLLTPSSQSSSSSLLSPTSPISPDSLSEWPQHSYPLPDSPESPYSSSPDCVLLRDGSITSHSLLECNERDDKHEASTLKQPPLSPLGISDSHPYAPLSFYWYSSPPEINPLLVLDDLDLQGHSFPSGSSPEIEYMELQGRTADSIIDNQTKTSSWAMGDSCPSSPQLNMDLLPSFDLDYEFYSPISPPDSPAKRSFTALPDDMLSSTSLLNDLHTSEVDDTHSRFSPQITTLLSLPGAEADEDLIPVEVGMVKIMPSERLLSMMDGGEFLGTKWNQRSPGPEPCAMLDADVVASELPGDEDLKRACGLLKRMRDAERATKHLEAMIEEEERVKSSMLTGAGSLPGNTNGTISCSSSSTRLSEARKTTKRRRERVREVATLLRLKLAQRGWKVCKTATGTGLIPVNMDDRMSSEGSAREQQSVSSGKIGSKCMIASPHQLLAKMVMDRHEPKCTPPSKRIIISGRSAYHKIPTSPLAKWSTSTVDVYDDKDENVSLSKDHDFALDGITNVPVELDSLDLGFTSDGWS